MQNMMIAAQLPTNTPMTLRQLLAAAIAARTYSSAQIKTESTSRIPARAGECFIRPAGADVYMMDAYKGVGPGGAAIAADFTLPGDFTAGPGGGDLLEDGVSRRSSRGVALGSRLFYQNSGGDVTAYFDISE